MTIDFSKHDFAWGGEDIVEEGNVYPYCGITVSQGYEDLWLDRIQCYGNNHEEAQALRNRVMKGLELVAAQEREEAAFQAATETLKNSGLLTVGTANIGSQVISAGLGGKDE